MVNEALLREAVDWAKQESKKPKDKREWKQDVWLEKTSCGTRGCIAGWTVVVSGERLGTQYGSGAIKTTADGKSIQRRAQELLGLNDVQADTLFRGYNSAETLEQLAEQIIEGKL